MLLGPLRLLLCTFCVSCTCKWTYFLYKNLRICVRSCNFSFHKTTLISTGKVSAHLYRHWGYVQAVRPTGGVRGIALLFLDHGTRTGWRESVTPQPLFTHGKDPVPIVQEAGWAPGPVWIGVENFAPTRIRTRTVQPVASRYTDYATRPIR